jgi:LacI family transcriptional regulator
MEKSAVRKRSVTVADVAKAAKVAKATAARVLGGYGVVSDKARVQVLTAAQALDYRPNELARSMTTGKSGIIGVVVGDIENAFFSLAVRGISDAARLAGFNVIIANSGEKLEAEKAAIGLLIGKRVDGLIVTPSQSRDAKHLEDIGKAGIPLVLFDRRVADIAADSVTGNDRQSAMAATRLLVGVGHRHIAYITSVDADGDKIFNVEQLYTSSVRERVEGYLQVLREAGVADPERLVRVGASGLEKTEAVVRRLLSNRPRATALIASDSLVGLDVFRAIRSMGLLIPDDVSLISFFDADWTSVTSPPITVVDQPVYDLGRKAAERLLLRLSGDHTPAHHMVLDTAIISRSSVGGPKID